MKPKPREECCHFGRSFWVWGILLGGGCAGPAQNLSAVDETGAYPGSKKVPAFAESTPDSAAGRVRFTELNCPIASTPWSVRVRNPRAGSSVDAASVSSELVDITGANIPQIGQLWVRLDAHLPRPLPTAPFPLSMLGDELVPIAEGPHRVVVYGGLSDGTALFADPRKPLASVVDFSISSKTPVASAKARDATAQAAGAKGQTAAVSAAVSPLLVFGPTSTLNGEDGIARTLFQVALGTESRAQAAAQLDIAAPDGSRHQRQIAGGCYGLSGLVSGEYRFVVSDGKLGTPVESLFVVNLD